MLQAELKVLGGKFQGKAIPLTHKRFLVGREQDCHLRPNSDSVSRHHCVFVQDDYGLRLRDLGSTNGTRVNGELIRQETVLNDGDVIHIGKLELQLALRQVEAAPVAQPVPEKVKTPGEFEVTSGKAGSETMYEIPTLPQEAGQTTTNFGADTTILGASAQQPPPLQQFPVPGYPPGSFPQGYPQGYPQAMMPQGYPQGYPQGFPQGYPQGGMPGYPPGYGAPQYAPPQYAPPGYGVPTSAAAPATTTAEEDREAAAEAAGNAIPIKLPPPESTGAKLPQPPAPKPAAEGDNGKPPEIPSNSAADIIKNYMQRRSSR